MIDLFNYIENHHVWEYGQTNEYCIHCGHIFESDLGWTSASGVQCIERKIEFKNLAQFPKEVRSYCNYRGLIFNKEKIFVKPYSDYTLTIKEMSKIINSLI